MFNAVRYMEEHPKIYRLFVNHARWLYQAGIRRCGARKIVEGIRWTEMIRTGKDGFKINNNVVPFMARRLMKEHPMFKGFFSTRTR